MRTDLRSRLKELATYRQRAAKKRQMVEPESEPCVLCGRPTGVMPSDDISRRAHYVEGGGQLCAKCHETVYGR